MVGWLLLNVPLGSISGTTCTMYMVTGTNNFTCSRIPAPWSIDRGLKRAEPTLIRAPLRPKMSLTSLSKCTPAHGEGPPGLESPTFQSAVHVAHIPLNHARQLYWTVLSLRYVELNHWRIYNIRNSKCLPYTPTPKILPPPSPSSLVHINQQGAFGKHGIPFLDRIQIQIKQNLQCTNFHFAYQ